MKVNVQVDTQTFVRFWLVILGFVLAGFMIYSARTGLTIVGTALFFALALNGPVTKIAGKLPGKSRIGSTAIAYLLVVAFLGTFIFLAVPPIIQQTAKFASTVPDLIDNGTKSWHSLDSTIEKYNLRPQVDQTLNSFKENASRFASSASSNIVSGIGSIFSFFAALFLVLVLSFLMLVEGPVLMRKVWGLYHNKARMEHHRKTVVRMANVVSGYVTGQLTVSSLDGLFSGLVVFLISLFVPAVPANLAIATAAIMFVFSLIPLFGALVGAVIVSILLVFNAVPAAIAFALFFVVYQQLENNIISPAIQSKRLKLSPLLVLTAVTIGAYVFGIAGAIISIPIAGCIKVLLEEYLDHVKRIRDKHNAEERSSTKLAKQKA